MAVAPKTDIIGGGREYQVGRPKMADGV